MKPLNSLIATAMCIGIASTSFAVDEYNVSSGAIRTGESVALRGNDTVALALGLGVVSGYANFTHIHDGVAYYFASEESQAAFASDPDAFQPQYGGYCAFGVAFGKKLDSNPRFADIVDGKLYLFLDAAAYLAYKKDKEGTLAMAKKNWPGMRHVSVAEVNSR